jgi:PPK2 family polyphosphate:nucleotide phosphotransferase
VTNPIGTLARIVPRLRVKPGQKVSMARFNPTSTAPFRSEKHAAEALTAGIETLTEYQSRLSAQDSYAVLVVLQGLDASGKDGAIKHVMSGMNPSAVRVRSFKVPTTDELAHDYLWRYDRWLPERGSIGIFNRSHYEEVLAVRVHPEFLLRQHLPPEARQADTWERRYRDINDWERHLVDNGIRVAKILLNISREEQRRRFLERIDNPRKWWKFSAADVHERHWWDDYQRAFAAMLSHTSTEWAPWHVVPADHKWFARLAVAAVLVDTLVGIDPHYPEPSLEDRAELAKARAELAAEA